MDPKHKGELSPEELEREIAEALPERAAMSTVSMTGLDAATGTVEAVSDGVTESAAATAEPEMATTAAPEPVEATTAEPAPAEAAPDTVAGVTPVVDETLGTVTDAVEGVTPVVGDTVETVGGVVGDTLGTV